MTRAAAIEPQPGAASGWSRPGEDWPGFLGPTQNGRSSLRGLAVPWGKGGPRIVWTAELGEGYCSPAVAAGKTVVFDRVADEARLRCLAAETGQVLWEQRYPCGYTDLFGYDGGPRACPVIAGDRVITHGPEGLLACWSLASGEPRWRVDTAATYHVVQNFFGVGAAPIVWRAEAGGDGGRVIVQVGGSHPESAPADPQRLDLVRGLDSGLVAFDLGTGREIWRASDQLASYSTPVVARFGGRERLLAWMRDDLLCVDPAHGLVLASFRWRADELFSVVAASPVVDGTEVLLSETYGPGSVLLDFATDPPREIRRDPPTGRPRNALFAHWATPVLHDGCLYGSSGRHAGDALLVCVDWRTGRILWSERGLGRASVAYVDGHLIVLGEFGDLILARASPAGYQEVSRARLTDPLDGSDLLVPPCWAAPVIAHGYLYVRAAGRLVCLDLLGR
jgi:outer membrane protein assembly factor BamB